MGRLEEDGGEEDGPCPLYVCTLLLSLGFSLLLCIPLAFGFFCSYAIGGNGKQGIEKPHYDTRSSRGPEAEC